MKKAYSGILLPISVSVVIPLYNNEKTALPQLDLCLKLLKSNLRLFEILIINDASTDSSERILKRFCAQHKETKYYNHKINKGISETIYELYGKAKSDYVLLFSVDGEWDPYDIVRLIKYIYGKRADIVIGKRDKHCYTPYRKFISFLYNLMPVILFGIKTIDAGSIKVFKKEIFQDETIRSRSLFFEAEMIIKAAAKNKIILSLPVTYKRDKKDSGTAAKWANVFGSLKDLLCLRFSL
jgi:glycosyltransferase involved in cell wall biosynthesis